MHAAPEATRDEDPVLVVGGGPAGLGLAAALARQGLPVELVRAQDPPSFANSYGMWVDEAEALGVAGCLVEPSRTTRVGFGRAGGRSLERGYGRIDAGRLETLLDERAREAGVRFRRGRARGYRLEGEGAEQRAVLELEGGEGRRAAALVDATGHHGVLVQRAPPEREAFQVAFGVEVAVARESAGVLGDGESLLMDFSPVDEADEAGGFPTFLYGLPLGGGRVFLEETSLVSSPGLPVDVLEERLRRRLAALGLVEERGAGGGDPLEAGPVERCVIPLGLPLPDLEQPVLGFGGAASLVHPATGYMLAPTLGLCDEVAAALARALAGGAGAAEAARSGWRALWTPGRRRTRELQLFGMQLLIDLDADETRRFFAAFFGGPDAAWRAYMDPLASSDRVAAAMIHAAMRLPAGLAMKLIAATATRPGVVSPLMMSVVERFGGGRG